MSSFSTAGGGVKAATSIPAGRKGMHNAAYNICRDAIGGLAYLYTASSVETAVSVTGRGYWTVGYFMVAVVGQDTTSATVKATIDGVVVLDDSTIQLRVNGMAQVGNLMVDTTPDMAAGGGGLVPFNKSLLIEVSCNVNAVYLYNYYLS